jgi:RND family efflux transporter MFP subunit
MNKRSFLVGLAIGAPLALGLAAAMGYLGKKRAGGPPAAFRVENDAVKLQKGIPMHFETQQAELGAPLPRPPVTARVTTIESRTAPTFAPLEGRVEKSAVALGDKVEKGAHLVLIRSGDLAGMVRELKAERLSVQTKRSIVERLRLLVESRAASANDLTVAQHELEEAELSAKAADARLRSLAVAEEGDNLYWLLASRQGTVVQLDAAPGLEVGPSKDRPVTTIADLGEVYVEADVRQQDTFGLQPGSTANIYLGEADSTAVPGKIASVAQVVDPARQTVPVRVRMDNASKVLRPNAFVQVVFGTENMKPVLRVPTEAVVSDGMRSVVFVETEEGTFQRRTVVVGRQDHGMTEVLENLQEGERVVTRGALLLLNALNIEG